MVAIIRHCCTVLTLLTLLTPISCQQPELDLSGPVGKMFADNMAEHLAIELKEMTKKYTNYHKISEAFSKLNVVKNKINGDKLLNNFTKSVEALFDERTKVLHEIKKNAEKSKARNTNKNVALFNYHNMRDINQNDNVSLIIVPTFSKTVPINLTDSFVQVPTNIYSGKEEVLYTAKWTKEIDPTFKANFFNFSEKLLYQYYGDSSGLFRIYPGNKNGNDGKTDLFDCRRRIWYIQATSSPKDVVIVIDTSGSMIGNNIGIAKITAASLIDTLQENDYFNVITINKEVTYVKPCLKFMVQATKENKEIMKYALQKIETPTDIVDINLGMTEAFDILESGTYYNRTYADCNQAIMFITDGVEGEYAGEEVFEKRNKNRKVRAFAYLVGRYKSPDKQALIDMACKNRGYFYSIETLGNVWDTVLEYLKVFSRPIGRENSKQKPSYTPVYLDSTGLGMVMSVSLGVFEEKELIGVTGTDIALASIQEKILSAQLGFFSHVFMINNNGFVLVHPKFRDQTGYLPAPPNVYVDDLERGVDTNQTELLKIDMIDQKTGQESFPTYWIYDENKKIMTTDTSYFFTAMNNTDFSAAVAILTPDENYYEITDADADIWMMKGIEALHLPFINKTENYTAENYTYVQISPWMFCTFKTESQNEQPRSLMYFPTAEELFDFIKSYGDSKDIGSNCDGALLKKLLTTAGIVTEIVETSWQPDNIDKDIIESLFVATIGGYSRYITYTNTSKPFQRDIHKVGIVQMAAAMPDVNIGVTVPKRGEKDLSDDPVFATIAGTARIDGMLGAVSGMKMSTDNLYQALLNASAVANIKYSTERLAVKVCADNNTHVCAILDYNGYIMQSNQGNKYIGKFVGEVVGKLMEHLSNENISIFTKIVLNDTQAECPIPDKYDSASSILLTPAKLMFNFAQLLLGSLSWMTTQVYFSLLSFTRHQHVHGQEIKKVNVSCTKEMPFYVFNKSRWEKHQEIRIDERQYRRQINCVNCPQKYALSPIKETNLIFFIADTCPDCRQYKVRTTPIKKEDPSICTAEVKYRRRPDNCFNQTEKDLKSAKCGKAIMETPSLLLLVTLLLTTLLTANGNG